MRDAMRPEQRQQMASIRRRSTIPPSAPGHLAEPIAAYKFYVYRHRLAEALSDARARLGRFGKACAVLDKVTAWPGRSHGARRLLAVIDRGQDEDA
jgi:hypothetical protein